MTKRGSAARFFGPQIGIHYRILMKFGELMDTMGLHHHANFFPKRPTDGGVIADARYFWSGHVAKGPEPK